MQKYTLTHNYFKRVFQRILFFSAQISEQLQGSSMHIFPETLETKILIIRRAIVFLAMTVSTTPEV